MNKLMFWEFLKENPGWHTSKKLRDMWDIKQLHTLKSWVDPRFIGTTKGNKMLLFRFIEGTEAVYEQAMLAEMRVAPQKAVINNKVQNVPAAFNDERFTVAFPFPDSEVAERAKVLTKGWAEEGEDQEFIREWIRQAYEHRLDPVFPKRFRMFINVVYGIMRNNTNTEYLEELMAPLTIEDESIEERRAMEMDDIMSRLPKNDLDLTDIPHEFFR